MPTQNLDSIFEALGNKHRREIIYSLGLQPHSISQLATLTHLSLPAINKHIKLLEQANLVTREKTGQTNYLTLKLEALQDLQKWITQFHPYWGNDKQTLENYQNYLKGGEKK